MTLRRITDHPRFRGSLGPDHPAHDHVRYLESLSDAEGLIQGEPPEDDEMDLDVAELILEPEELMERAIKRRLQVGLSICRDCINMQDRRAWWKKLFFPEGVLPTDLLCKTFLRKQVRNPITGKEGYLPEGTHIPSHAFGQDPYPPCVCVNPSGTCRMFSPKITYR